MNTNHTRRGNTQEVNQNKCHAEKSLLSTSTHKKNCHCRGFLSGISTTFEMQGGYPRQRHSVMTPNLMGFTLIELLVVVLIIGILAAVALPQYNKAVEKARTAEALNILDSLQQGIDSWLLTNDFPSEHTGGPHSGNVPLLEQLDVEISANYDRTYDAYQTRDFVYVAECTISPKECWVVARQSHNFTGGAVGSQYNYAIIYTKSAATNEWTKSYITTTGYMNGDKICAKKDLSSYFSAMGFSTSTKQIYTCD